MRYKAAHSTFKRDPFDIYHKQIYSSKRENVILCNQRETHALLGLIELN